MKIKLFTFVLFSALISSSYSQIKVPDSAFRQKLTDSYGILFNSSKEIVNTEISDTITVLSIPFAGITDVTGLTAFPALKNLNCSFNSISQIDLSANSGIEVLDVSENQLTSLDVSGLPKLSLLNTFFNPITELKLDKNPLLSNLYCVSNHLDSLDLRANNILKQINCNANQLKWIALPADSMLQTLNIFDNLLDTLVLDSVPNIYDLKCSKNKLKYLRLSDNPGLFQLYAYDNQLGELDLSACPQLYQLECSSNRITRLIFGQNNKLEYMNCSGNLLDSLNCSHFPNLVTLSCSQNNLSSLDISGNPKLEMISCYSNKLESLDVSQNLKMYSINCDTNSIETLDVSNHQGLVFLSCAVNKLSTLDISGCPELLQILCPLNPITSLNISENRKLMLLNVENDTLLTACFTWTLPFPTDNANVFKPNCPVKFYLGGAFPETVFGKFLVYINSLPAAGRQAVADSFYNTLPVLPLIEAEIYANYIYQGNGNNASIAGDMNNWSANASPMTRITGTNFWYLSQVYESDARLDYKIVVNNGTWMLDPKNPNIMPSGLGTNSEMSMPAYVPAPEIEFYPEIPHGQLIDIDFKSKILGNTRKISIYLPAAYNGTDSFQLAIFHDGQEYISLAKANNTLDYLIANKKMDPIAAVFIPPVDRFNEYVGAKTNQFANFIATELLPYIYSNYNIKKGPENTASIGISNGGDISEFLGFKLNDMIGYVGSFSAAGGWHTSEYMNSPKLNLKFYLDCGTYDAPGFLSNNEFFLNQVLVAKEYEHLYYNFHEGHSWGNWRAHLHFALEYFFPWTGNFTGTENETHLITYAIKSYPNPATDYCTLEYENQKSGQIEFKIFNSSGILVKSINEGFRETGKHSEVINLTEMEPGIYLCVFSVDGSKTETARLVVQK
jgi:enterochelin esterase-like enzyme